MTPTEHLQTCCRLLNNAQEVEIYHLLFQFFIWSPSYHTLGLMQVSETVPKDLRFVMDDIAGEEKKVGIIW